MSAAAEALNKLRMQKKSSFKTIQKLLENSTQFEEYLTGLPQPWALPLPSNGSNEFDNGDNNSSYVLDADTSNTPVQILSQATTGDNRLADTINDNFFYQHMFNFALVVILLLQVIVVWAFIWCRLSKYAKQAINSQAQMEDGIALRDMGPLPEIIPRQQQVGDDMEHDGNWRNGGDGLPLNRCARYG